MGKHGKSVNFAKYRKQRMLMLSPAIKNGAPGRYLSIFKFTATQLKWRRCDNLLIFIISHSYHHAGAWMGQSPIISGSTWQSDRCCCRPSRPVDIENHLGAGVSHLAGNETRVGPGRQRPAGVSVSRLIRLAVP
jgi:hypothetical protein